MAFILSYCPTILNMSKNELHGKMSYGIKYSTLVLLSFMLYGCTGFQGFTSVETKLSKSSGQLVVANIDQKTPSGHHRVQKGETLYSIAFSYGSSFHALASVNNIQRPYTIYPHQMLKIVPANYVAKKRTKARVSSGNKLTKSNNSKSNIAKTSKSIRHTKPITTTKGTKLFWEWPAKGSLIGRFTKNSPGAKGIDIAGRMGESVLAAATGKIVYAGNGLLGYGNLIIIKHNDQFLSAYAHNRTILVKEQQDVKAGQKIAEIGATGSDKVKLHFEIRRNGNPVDPLKYLPKR